MRRHLRFDSLDQAMGEAERLASGSITTSGRYSLGQILDHLARALDLAIGVGPTLYIPWIGRVIGRLIRGRIIKGPPRPGFKLPKKGQALLWSSENVTTEMGMQRLRAAYDRFRQVREYQPHPFFGKLTDEEHRQLQCRHFELHLGFVHPVANPPH